MDCYFVFIVSGPRASALHTGLTCNLTRRLSRLREESADAAAPRLLYYEVDHDAEAACRRERQLRRWSRARRAALVDSMNPQRDDLSRKW